MTATAINTSTKSLLQLFEHQGFSTDTILSTVNARAEAVFAPQGRLEISQMAEIWCSVYKQAAPTIGLQAANNAPIGAYGVLDYLMMSMPTFNDALLMLRKFYPLINSGAKISVHHHRKLTFIELLNPPETPCEHLRRSAEYTFAIFLQRFRAACGKSDLKPFRVDFTFAPPKHFSAYQKTFQTKLRFNQTTNRIVFERDWLALPTLRANPELAERLKHSAEKLLAEMPFDDKLVENVRDVLRAHLKTGSLSLKTTARTLAISERNLQRKLYAGGTSYQAVLDNLRYELAFDYLSKNLSSGEIAYLLGFSEASAFSRAFKTWTGKSPHEITHNKNFFRRK